MREIKFRAWDTKMKRWLNMEQCVTPLNKMNRTNSCEFMQFTGLLDKHGKEIYEGDRLGGEYGDCFIIWCHHCCSFELFADLFGCFACEEEIYWPEVVADKDLLEVIGNIYED